MAKTSIFAAKTTPRTMKKRKVFSWFAAHILFCVIVIAVFGNFCRLRPVAAPYVYKEYLSGVFVLAATYTILLLWVPLCLSKNRPALFTLLSLLTVLIAAGGEILLVYPQIHSILSLHFGQDMIRRYILHSFLFVLARNVGFALLASMLGIILLQKKRILGNERRIFNQYHQIEIPQKAECPDTVDVQNITHCLQFGNYTRIYLKNGKYKDLYSTLMHVYKLVGDTYAVRISRNCIVMYDALVEYTEQYVKVRNGEQQELICFNLPRRNADNILKQIKSHQNTSHKENHTLAVNDMTKRWKFQLSRKQKSIYNYISNHPGCTANDISKRMNVTHNTIYRHIARLKQQGLIEHVGANKTGGYRVVER